MPSGAKKLFLVDAMAHVTGAFFAPMPQRLTGLAAFRPMFRPLWKYSQAPDQRLSAEIYWNRV